MEQYLLPAVVVLCLMALMLCKCRSSEYMKGGKGGKGKKAGETLPIPQPPGNTQGLQVTLPISKAASRKSPMSHAGGHSGRRHKHGYGGWRGSGGAYIDDLEDSLGPYGLYQGPLLPRAPVAIVGGAYRAVGYPSVYPMHYSPILAEDDAYLAAKQLAYLKQSGFAH